MPADKFLSYSKFNKKYFNPYYLDSDLINFMPVTYLLCQDSLTVLQEQYSSPNTHHLSPNGYMTTFYNSQLSSLSDSDRVKAYAMYEDFMSLNQNFHGRIFPYDLDSFVSRYYPNTLPSEKYFIVDHMINFNKIINRDSYIIISFQPFTKDEYEIIKQHWVDSYSIASVIKNLKQIQTVVDNHKKDLRYLLAKNDELAIENQQLKDINQDLSNQIYRSTFTNWS